jgi:hypothetical protein
MSTDLIPANTASVMPYDQIEKLAQKIATSKMFGIQNSDQAIVLMMICQADGLNPIEAVRRYHVLNGRPTMRADAMLASYQAKGGTVEWTERTNEAVSATFTHPSSGAVPVRWTMEDAKRAGLLSNPTWQKYPRQMLTARVISEGIRTSLPGVVAGIYTPEEVKDIVFAEQIEANVREVREVQPVRPSLPAAPSPKDAEVGQVGQVGQVVGQPVNTWGAVRGDLWDEAKRHFPDLVMGEVGTLVRNILKVLGQPIKDSDKLQLSNHETALHALRHQAELLRRNGILPALDEEDNSLPLGDLSDVLESEVTE